MCWQVNVSSLHWQHGLSILSFMIAKNIKGKSFKGCVSYMMHEGATLLEAEGVWDESNQYIIRSFTMQRSGHKECLSKLMDW